MIDDTREVQSRPSFYLSQNINDILKRPVMREHAARWANNLRFLTFDDDSDDKSHCSIDSGPKVENAEKNELESLRGQCQPCERRVPAPSGHICQGHLSNRNGSGDREAHFVAHANPCVHVHERTCEDCKAVPLFPNEGKVTKFRIRRLYANGDERPQRCTHFVAVSYCWSSTETGQRTDQYEIVEEDGRTRKARAPNATIDRIVAFARENGFRMIWIDQECIEQDNPMEKELSIQAMDYVYLRAHISIGLFHTQLQQEHLDCLLLAYEAKVDSRYQRRGRRVLTGCRAIRAQKLYEAVSMVASDRWNTRAWILQEAFASSGNMLLLFSRGHQVNVRGWMLICHELSQSELAVQLDTLQQSIQLSIPMIQPMILRSLDSHDTAQSKRPWLPSRKAVVQTESPTEAKLLLKRLRFFHPQQPQHAFNIQVGTSKPRRTCNAAVAIAFLQLRDLQRVADKLAILANMCDYDLRLDTTYLEENHQSLTECLLALSLANSDFSLLIPEMYHFPEGNTISHPTKDDLEFSWAHSFTRYLDHVEMMDWNPFGVSSAGDAAAYMTFSEKGLSMLGTLWRVGEFIHMTPIQTKHADSWVRMRQAKGRLRPSQRTIHLATTQIIFEIIGYLCSINEKRLANSIFNSTSNWHWQQRSRKVRPFGMVESVDDYPVGLRVENRQNMFSLDLSADGWYHQCWIIDRIMNNGGVWVGCVVIKEHNKHSDEGQERNANIPDMPNRPQLYNSGTYTFNTSHKTYEPGSIQATDQERKLFEPETDQSAQMRHGRVASSHVDRMTMTAIATMFSEHVAAHQPATLDERQFITTPKATASFLALLARERYGASSMFETDAQRRAIFDVDGNAEEGVLVLTPMQRVLESIPRPAMRGMSVSMVVKRTENAVDDRTTANLWVQSMAKGMWEFSVVPSGRYSVS